MRMRKPRVSANPVFRDARCRSWLRMFGSFNTQKYTVEKFGETGRSWRRSRDGAGAVSEEALPVRGHKDRGREPRERNRELPSIIKLLHILHSANHRQRHDDHRPRYAQAHIISCRSSASAAYESFKRLLPIDQPRKQNSSRMKSSLRKTFTSSADEPRRPSAVRDDTSSMLASTSVAFIWNAHAYSIGLHLGDALGWQRV